MVDSALILYEGGALRIPKKIDPCPIVEAVVELRYESDVLPDTIAGITYGAFKNRFPEFNKLDIAQLPAHIVAADQSLKFAPHFRYSNKEFTFQVGPRSFSIVCPMEYKGWSEFRAQIEYVWNAMQPLGLIKKPLRVGLRYISFFESVDIFDNIKVQLTLAGKPLIGHSNILRTELKEGGFTKAVQISNGATMKEKMSGSVVDIDITSEAKSMIISDFMGIVDKAHQEEKVLFFGMLKDDFLVKFNPEY